MAEGNGSERSRRKLEARIIGYLLAGAWDVVFERELPPFQHRAHAGGGKQPERVE